MQHRASRYTWSANTESTWFILASTEGCKQYLDGKDISRLIQAAFHHQTRKKDPASRVFKFLFDISEERE